MESMEIRGSFSLTNVDDHKPQHTNTSLPIPTQTKIEKTIEWKRLGKQQVHDDVVFSYIHDKVIEVSEDDNVMSYQAKIYEIMSKQEVNANANISELHVACSRIPLCCIVAMPVVCPTLKTDVLKIEGELFNDDYQHGDRAFLFVDNQ